MLSRAKTRFRDASSVVATAFQLATVDMRSRHAPAKFASIAGVGAMSPLSCAFNWLTNSAFTRTKFGGAFWPRRDRPGGVALPATLSSFASNADTAAATALDGADPTAAWTAARNAIAC